MGALQYCHVAGNTGYIRYGGNYGVYAHGDGMCTLIDTGVDDDCAKKILKCLSELSLTPAAIINTHAHADHYGGNHYIVEMTGARVFSSPKEAIILENPEIEPFYLYSANPIQPLYNKFTCSKHSTVAAYLTPGENDVEGIRYRIIDLYGHSIGQIGVVTPDGILFCGDAIVPECLMKRFNVPYVYDVAGHLKTLDMLSAFECNGCISTHGPIPFVLADEAAANRMLLIAASRRILHAIEGKLTRDEIIARVITSGSSSGNAGRAMTIPNYFVMYSAISAFLSYLNTKNVVKTELSEGRLLWYRG